MEFYFAIKEKKPVVTFISANKTDQVQINLGEKTCGLDISSPQSVEEQMQLHWIDS